VTFNNFGLNIQHFSEISETSFIHSHFNKSEITKLWNNGALNIKRIRMVYFVVKPLRNLQHFPLTCYFDEGNSTHMAPSQNFRLTKSIYFSCFITQWCDDTHDVYVAKDEINRFKQQWNVRCDPIISLMTMQFYRALKLVHHFHLAIELYHDSINLKEANCVVVHCMVMGKRRPGSQQNVARPEQLYCLHVEQTNVNPTLSAEGSAGVGTLAFASSSLTSLMPPTETQCGRETRNEVTVCYSLFRTLMSFSGSFDMASTFPFIDPLLKFTRSCDSHCTSKWSKWSNFSRWQ